MPLDAATPRAPLLPVAVAFAAGIACDALFGSNTRVVLAVGLLLLLAWCRLRSRPEAASGASRRATWVSLSTLLLLAWSVGALRHHAAVSHVAADDLARLVTPGRQLVRLEGTVTVTPRVRLTITAGGIQQPRTMLEARADATWRSGRRIRLRGRLQLIVRGRADHLTVGDRFEVIGWLQALRGPRNPGGFDVRGPLVSRGIRALLVSNDPRSVQHRGPSRRLSDRVAGWQARLRSAGLRVLGERLSPRNAQVAAALLLGVRGDLAEEQREIFIHSGTMHLLAISGLHVGLLAGLLWMIGRLARLGPIPTTLLVIGGVLVYAVVTETRPSVVRATVLVVTAMLGRPWHRRAAGANALSLAALIVLLLRPGDLFSPGAQLSFLAVASLLWATPRAAAVLPATPGRGWGWRWTRRLLQAWLVSSVIWLVTAPLVAARFGLVAPVGLLVNVVLIPLVAIGLWLGFGLLLVGSWLPPAGWLCGVGLDLLLDLLLGIAELAAAGPLSYRTTPPPPDAWLWGFYGLLITVAACRDRRVRSRWLVALAAMLLVGLASGLARPRGRPLTITVLDVGHGGAILVECPGGATLLYDAGTIGDGRRVARIVRNALWHSRRRRLDALIVSHADRDHYNGTEHLFGEIPIGSLVFAHSFLDADEPGAAALIDAAAAAGVDAVLVSDGDRLQVDAAVAITVRHPPRRWRGSSDNTNSLVLELVADGRRVLLTGDIEHEGLDRLLERPTGRVDLLLAPHHGSPAANIRPLADWARPRLVVASGGRATTPARLRRCYGPETRVFTTRQAGAVRIRLTPQGPLLVRTWSRDEDD